MELRLQEVAEALALEHEGEGELGDARRRTSDCALASMGERRRGL
jgi:hypothetical protein